MVVTSVAAAPGDAYGCVPCKNNDCTGKSFNDRCASGVCTYGNCQTGGRRDLGGAEDLGLLNVTSVDGNGDGDGDSVEKRTGKIGHKCVVWVYGHKDALEACDVCDAGNPATYHCHKQPSSK